jgi:cytochrome b6-f complex iron-sulfur subunit
MNESEAYRMDSKEKTRREFCGQTCRVASVAALGAALATVLESCGGGGASPTSPGGGGSVSSLPTVNGTASGNAIVLTIDAGSPLSGVGGAALVRSSLGDVLVARTAQDSFTALSAVCTHEAREITGLSGQRYVCPFHGSQFDFAGNVVVGPAPRALRQYNAQLAGSQLTISA